MRVRERQEGKEAWKQAWEFCLGAECEAAIGALEQQVRAATDPDAHFQLGLCCMGTCRSHSLADPEIACAQFRQSLGTFPPEKRAERAATLGALGNAFSDLPEYEFPQKWQEAITHYERAPGARSPERSPRRQAATLLHQGAAYRELTAGDRSENIKRAIGCYRRALGICIAQASPEENASLHNNLGDAYLMLARMEPGSAVRSAEHALRHFDLALSLHTRDRRPRDYAATQLNRGEAFLEMLEADPASCLEKAATAFRDAEQCFALCGLTSYAGRAHERRAQVESVLASLGCPGASDEPAARDQAEGKKQK